MSYRSKDGPIEQLFKQLQLEAQVRAAEDNISFIKAFAGHMNMQPTLNWGMYSSILMIEHFEDHEVEIVFSGDRHKTIKSLQINILCYKLR